MMKKTIQIIVLLAAATGAFVLGEVLRRDPPASDAEIAYHLDRTGQREVLRLKLLADELRLRSLDTAQCIPQKAMPAIAKWADKCVIPECTIDIDGKPFTGIATPSRATPAKTTKPTK